MKRAQLFSHGISRKFTFSGTQYDCIPGSIDRTTGEFPEAICIQSRMSLRIWAADFQTLPAIGNVITYASTEYRVLDTHADNFGETLKLALGDKYNV